MNHKTQTRTVEIFSADCPFCEEAIRTVRELACDSCEIDVLDVRQPSVAERAAELGVRSVPAVAVNGRLAACCTERGIDEEALRNKGIGTPLS